MSPRATGAAEQALGFVVSGTQHTRYAKFLPSCCWPSQSGQQLKNTDACKLEALASAITTTAAPPALPTTCRALPMLPAAVTATAVAMRVPSAFAYSPPSPPLGCLPPPLPSFVERVNSDNSQGLSPDQSRRYSGLVGSAAPAGFRAVKALIEVPGRHNAHAGAVNATGGRCSLFQRPASMHEKWICVSSARATRVAIGTGGGCQFSGCVGKCRLTSLSGASHVKAGAESMRSASGGSGGLIGIRNEGDGGEQVKGGAEMPRRKALG